MAPTWILIVSTVINGLSLIVNMPHIIILHIMPSEKLFGAKNNRLMLLHIAVLDILTTAIRMPLDSQFLQHTMDENHWLCGLTAILGYGPHVVCNSILVIGCIDRLIAVRHPTSYSQWFLPKHIAWFYWIPYVFWIAALTALTVMYEEQILTPRGFTICYYNAQRSKPLLFLLLIPGVLLPMAIILTLYAVMIITVCRRHSMAARGEAGYAVQAAKIIMAILITYFVLWIAGPLQVIVYTVTGKPSQVLWFLASLTIACNSGTHPIIYGLMNRK